MSEVRRCAAVALVLLGARILRAGLERLDPEQRDSTACAIQRGLMTHRKRADVRAALAAARAAGWAVRDGSATDLRDILPSRHRKPRAFTNITAFGSAVAWLGRWDRS